MDRRITHSFKDADIMQITEAVSAATGKNFIIDPRVRAQMTMLSSTQMSPDAFYQAFLWIPQVQAAIETDRKYNYIRDEQRKVAGETEKLPLLPDHPLNPTQAIHERRYDCVC
jgi:general secretion pathway protein D